MKEVMSAEDSVLLIKVVTQTIENETRDKGLDLLVCYLVLQVLVKKQQQKVKENEEQSKEDKIFNAASSNFQVLIQYQT